VKSRECRMLYVTQLRVPVDQTAGIRVVPRVIQTSSLLG